VEVRGMGIEVQLRAESGEILDEVGDPRMVLSRATRSSLSGTRLLRYIVPWGDAIFNQAQADDLAADIRIVKEANPGTPLFEILSAIEPLVEKLSREVHMYLWFVGD
jgi:hypothetical protein